MINFKLSQAPTHLKLLATTLLCTIGLTYLSLLSTIYFDTEFKISMIAEGYGPMEAMELAYHTHLYLPYYALFIFTLPVLMLMFTSYNDKLKSFFAVFPFIVIIADISSMWFISYVHTGFSVMLLLAGSFLGVTLISLIVLNLYDIWLRKA